MKKMQIICTSCPVGCRLEVNLSDSAKITVSGNRCKRGEIYGIDEATAPKRIVTTTIKVTGGTAPMTSVKTSAAVDKSKMFNVINAARDIELAAPLTAGQVVVRNIAKTDADLVVTKTVNSRS